MLTRPAKTERSIIKPIRAVGVPAKPRELRQRKVAPPQATLGSFRTVLLGLQICLRARIQGRRQRADKPDARRSLHLRDESAPCKATHYLQCTRSGTSTGQLRWPIRRLQGLVLHHKARNSTSSLSDVLSLTVDRPSRSATMLVCAASPPAKVSTCVRCNQKICIVNIPKLRTTHSRAS